MALPTLFQLTDEFKQIEALADGDPEAFAQALDDINGDLETKMAGYVMVYKTLQAQQALYEKEAKALTAHARALGNSSEDIKERLRMGMVEWGRDKLEVGVIRARMQNGGIVIDVDEAEVDPNWRRATLTIEAKDIPKDMPGMAVISIPNAQDVPEEVVGHEGLRTTIDKAGLLAFIRKQDEGEEPPKGVTVRQTRTLVIL